MTLTEWAHRWQIPHAAMQELARTAMFTPETPELADSSESAVQSRVRLAAARVGWRLWRNNSGAGQLANGSFVRWGLSNDSPGVNALCKSGDLIGLRAHLVTAADVGRTLGVFISRECKRSDWHHRGTPEDEAQLRFATIVNALGGDAKIITNEAQL